MNSLHGPLHGFLPCFPVMTPYQSQTAFMFSLHVSLHVPLHVSRHGPLSNDLHVPLHVPLYVPRHGPLPNGLYVPRHGPLPNGLHVSPSWLPTKKVMQKPEKFLYLALLTSSLSPWRVESNWPNFQSGRVTSGWKYEQSDPISVRVQNVNPKPDSTISLAKARKDRRRLES